MQITPYVHPAGQSAKVKWAMKNKDPEELEHKWKVTLRKQEVNRVKLDVENDCYEQVCPKSFRGTHPDYATKKRRAYLKEFQGRDLLTKFCKFSMWFMVVLFASHLLLLAINSIKN